MGNFCMGDDRKDKNLDGFKAIMGKLNENYEAKIIILGLDGAGKTAIFNSLTGSDKDYKELQPTGGFNTKKVDY